MRLAHMVKIQDRPVSSCNIHFLNLQTFLSHLSFNWVLKNSKPYMMKHGSCVRQFPTLSAPLLQSEKIQM